MSGFVSVGSTPQKQQTICLSLTVKNDGLTHQQHSVMSANFSSVGMVLVRPAADTHSCLHMGISNSEVLTN